MKKIYHSFLRQYRFYILILLVCNATGNMSFAQDFQYSMYGFTPINVNPALVGANNDQDASMIYRNQMLGSEAGLHSTQLNFTHPLISKYKGRWGGIGLQVSDDRTGEASYFTRQSVTGAFAYNFNFGTMQSFTVGLSAGLNIRSIGSSAWKTGSQWSGSRYTNALPVGEEFQNLRQAHFNINTGAHYRKTDALGREKIYAGFSLSNLNKPTESFADTRVLPSTFLVNAGVMVWSNTLLALTPTLLYTNRASHTFINAGAKLNYSLQQLNSSVLSDRGSIDFGASYVNEKAIVASVVFNQPSFNVGFSYDIDFNPKANARAFRGAPEFAIRFFKTFDAKVSKRPAKKKTVKKKKKKKAVKKKNTTRKKAASKQDIDYSVKPRTKPLVPELEKLPAAEPETNDEEDRYEETEEVMAKQVDSEQAMTEESEFLNRNIYFDFNEAIFENKEASEFLNKLADYLARYPEQNIKIVGHTDHIGKAAFNLVLSKRRAQAVANYLIERGVARRRITVEGKGFTQPLVPNTTDENRAKNRRVEILPR